jgi:putative phosphoesterase
MEIGIVSDTHSRYGIISRVVDLLLQRKVACVLHCGDIEDGRAVELFQPLPTHFVFGNCDTYREEIRQAVAASGASLYDYFGSLELGGRRIAWLHGDDQRLFRDVEQSGFYDFLFYGHTHRAEQHQSGPTLVVNPGALHRAKVKTFLILDPAARKLESIVVPT